MEFQQSFDIDLAFDGGVKANANQPTHDVWEYMDRAAAQASAYLLAGAANGDVPEAVNMLQLGDRWELGLVHVVDERSYSPAIRCILYREMLPWNEFPDSWNRETNARRKRNMLLIALRNIERAIAEEPVPEVREWFQKLRESTSELRKPVSCLARWPVIGKLTGELSNLAKLLQKAMDDEIQLYSRILESDPPSIMGGDITPEQQVCCINVKMSESERQNVARNGMGHSLGAIVNDAQMVQTQMAEYVSRYLNRADVDYLAHRGAVAWFDTVYSILIVEGTNSPDGIIRGSWRHQ